MMKNIAVIDAETDPFKFDRVPEPFLWGFYDGNNYIEIEDTTELAAFLYNKKLTVYAHNGGKFDFHFLLPFIEPGQNLFMINGRIVRVKLGKCTLIDSFAMLPAALADFGGKKDIDYAKMEKENRGLYMDEISRYLQADCIALYKAVTRFIEKYGKYTTIASAALNQWREMGGTVPRSSPEFYNEFRKFYYGGRVTPFESGILKGKWKIYDIKSAYPTAMTHNHPITTRYWTTQKPGKNHLTRAFVTVECDSYGALPFRTETGSIEFPTRRDIYHCTGWEYLAGLETGTIKDPKILECRVFDYRDTANFGAYVAHFYAEKMRAESAGLKAERQFAKLFLNSLYGKMAANPENYEEFKLMEFGDKPADGWFYGPELNGYLLHYRPLPEERHIWYNVATAASITGWVRAFLWRSICKVKRPIYCDTDSIICLDGSRLEIGKELGQWELEKEADTVAIAGKKLYACYSGSRLVKKACKGVNLTGTQIINVANGRQVTYKPDVPTFSIKTGIRFTPRRVTKTA